MATRVTAISRTFHDDPRDHDTIVAAFEGQGWVANPPVPFVTDVTILSHPDMPGQYRHVAKPAEPEQSIDEAMGIRP